MRKLIVTLQNVFFFVVFVTFLLTVRYVSSVRVNLFFQSPPAEFLFLFNVAHSGINFPNDVSCTLERND